MIGLNFINISLGNRILASIIYQTYGRWISMMQGIRKFIFSKEAVTLSFICKLYQSKTILEILVHSLFLQLGL